MSTPSLPRILIVDDEIAQMEALCATLRERGYDPTGVTSGSMALAALEHSRFDLLLSDLMMQGIDGITLLRQALKIDPSLVCIIMTGQGAIDTAVEAMKAGAFDYILKPFKLSVVLPILSRALGVRRLQEELGRTEQALARAEAFLEGAPDPVVIVDSKESIVLFNRQAEQTFGFSRRELLGHPVAELLPDGLGTICLPKTTLVLDGEATPLLGTNGECLAKRKDGSELPVEVCLSPVQTPDGPLLISTLRDISERRRTARREEAHLRRLQQLSELSLQLSGDPAVVFEHVVRMLGQLFDVRLVVLSVLVEADLHFKAVWIKGQVSHDVGQCPLAITPCAEVVKSKDLLMLRRVLELFPEAPFLHEHGVDGFCGFPSVNSEGRVTAVTWLLDDKPLELNGEDGQILRIVGQRIAAELDRAEQQEARNQAEQLLRESEELFRQVADNIHEVLWISDVQMSRMLYVSPAYEQIWHRSCESLTHAPESRFDSVHAEDRERVQEASEQARHAGRYNEEYRIVYPDGLERWIHELAFPIKDANGLVYRVVGVAEDITERKRAERQVLRSQRLESLGTLASGVAHDLNNALAPIMMSTELLLMEYPNASNLLDTVRSSTQRAAEMVRQLLTFARGAEGQRVLVQIQQLTREIGKLIRSTFPKNIELRLHSAPTLGLVLGDATQLHQILLNLCVNARDAMPQGGILSIKAESQVIDAAYAANVPEAQPGRYVRLSVEDTGTGIPPDILDRVFEPFFTTKGPEKGTGLGLSTVLGIVKGHGGFLQVYSTVGKGTSFHVHLPMAEGNAQLGEAVVAGPEILHGHGKTVLIVDDEASIRSVARTILERSGFRVLTATDGTDGIIQVAQNRTELHAVVTDLHMPGMDGLNLVRALRRMVPDVPIIVSSGRLEDSVAAELEGLGAGAVLNKPFTQEQLTGALQAVLGRTETSSSNAILENQSPL